MLRRNCLSATQQATHKGCLFDTTRHAAATSSRVTGVYPTQLPLEGSCPATCVYRHTAKTRSGATERARRSRRPRSGPTERVPGVRQDHRRGGSSRHKGGQTGGPGRQLLGSTLQPFAARTVADERVQADGERGQNPQWNTLRCARKHLCPPGLHRNLSRSQLEPCCYPPRCSTNLLGSAICSACTSQPPAPLGL